MDNRGEYENFGGLDSGQSLDASSSSDQREHWSSRQQQGNTVPGAPSTFLSSFRSALNSLSGLSQPRTTQEYDPSSMQIARQPQGYEEIGHGYDRMGHGYDGMGHGYDGMGHGYGGLSQGYGGLSQGYGGLSQGYDELDERNYGMGHGYDGMGQEYDGSIEGYYGTGNGYGQMSTYDPYGMSDIGLYGSSEFSMGSRGVLYGVSMTRTRYSGFGISSRTVGFQMRMGHGVMGMSMFELGHGHTHSTGSSRSYCPIHGTIHGINSHDMEELFGTQSASSTNESDNYQGPIITELPDDEDDDHGVERSNISEPSITANTNVDNDHSFTSFNMKRQTVSNTAPAPEQRGKKNKNIGMMKSKLGAAANKNSSVRKRSSPNNSPLPSLDLQTEIAKENDNKSNTVTDNNALHSSLDSQSQFQNAETPNKVTATILEHIETENKTNDKDIIVGERKSLQTSIVFETNNKDVETKSKTDENKAIDIRFTENHQMREEINAKSCFTLNGNEAEVQDTTTYTDDPEIRENTSFSNNNENDSHTNRLDTNTNSSTKHKVSLTFQIDETADDNPSNYNIGKFQDESEAGSHTQPMFSEKVAKGEDRTSSSKAINAAMALRRELDETLTNLGTESIVNTEATKQDCISPEPECDMSSTQKDSCVSDSRGSSGHLDRMTSNFDKEVNPDEINKENTDLLSKKEKVEIIDHFPGTWLQSPEEFLSGGGDKEANQEVFPDLEMNSNLGECMSYSQLHTDLGQNTETRDSVYENRTANEFVQSIEANGTEGVNVENKEENQVQFTLNDQSSLVYNGDHLETSQLEIKSDISDDDDSPLSDDHLDECEFDQECIKSTKESYGNRNKSNQPEIRDKNRVLIGMSAEDRTNKEQLKRSEEPEHITKFSGTLGDEPKKKENTVAVKNVEDNSNPEKEYSSNVESIDKKSPSTSKSQSQKTRQKNATPKVYTKKELNLPTIDIRDELENNNYESTDNLQIKTEYMSNDNNTGDSAKKTVYFKSDQNIDDPAGKTVFMNEDYCKEVQWRYPGENIEKQNRKVPNDFKNNYEDLNRPPSSNANVFENHTTFSSQQRDGSSDGYKSEENQSGTSTSYAEPYHDSGLGDPFGHPDWQWLDEFADDNHHFKGRKKSLKRNKNANANVQIPSVDVDDKTVPKQSENMTSHQEGHVEGATASGSSTSAYPKTSHMYKTTSELSEMVAKEGLIVKDIYPDGNCLFAAVVDQLRVRGEFFYTAKTLREAAVKYLREHPCQPDGTPLSSFMSHYYCKTWDEYLDTMGQDGEWGDHIVISAIANVLKRRLVILGGVHTMHRTVMEPAHRYDESDISSLSNQNTSSSTTNKHTADLEMVAVVQTNENDATEGDTLKPKDLVTEGNDATGRNASKSDESETFSSSSASLNAPKEHEPFDDLYLGHITESHYLSLRHHDWEPRLHSCLRNKTGSCFLCYGASNAGNDRRAEPPLPCSHDVPDRHITFFMKYLLMSKHIYASFIKDTEIDKEVSTETLTTVMYHSMFDELGAFILHLDSNSAWTKCGKMIGQTDCPKDPTDVNVYFYQEPKDTKVLTSNGVNAEAQLKDLLSDTEGCHFGYTTLVPVSPYIWMNTTEYVNGKPYLRHLKINLKNSKKVNSIIAFKCQLPKEAHEWLHRPRAHGWPSAELIGKIALDGCQVIPSRHQSCNLQSPPEWEFCFRNAERKLIREAVTNEQRECFRIGEVMMNYILKSSKIEYTHLRQVFFFMCEETTNSMWVEKPIMCVHLLIERLLDCCRSGYLPNYFISKNNMIAHVNKEDLRDCSEKIELIRKHLFIVLYFALDAHNQIQTVATVLDGVIEDIQRYGFHGNAVRSMNECFIPITVQGLAAYGQLKEYKLLLDQSVQAYNNLANLGERHASCLTLNELLLKVLQYISSKHLQWLCAFYLDQQLGTTFTEYVCENFPTVSIFHFFGRDIGTHLHTISGDIMIPSFLTHTEMLPKLACDFTLLLIEHLHMDGVVGEQMLPYFFQHYKSSILQVVQNPDVDEFARTMCSLQMKILFTSLVAGTMQKLTQTVSADVNKQKLIVEEHLKNGRKAEAVIAMSQLTVFVQSVTKMKFEDIPKDWTKFCTK